MKTETQTRQTWQLDPAHTLVEFGVRHMMVSTVKGRFDTVSGTIEWDPENLANSFVQAEIATASLNSGNAQRDEHLKSADFLEVERFPTMTFRSTRIEPVGDDRARIHGLLTLRDVTREVVLDTELFGKSMSPWGTEAAGFEARATISRKDFGLTWNAALETGGVLVGDDVKISLAVEANRAA